MILITGGAGFIGSNFVLDWLSDPKHGQEPVINLDLLTYAGNTENLSSITNDPRYQFIHGDIRNTELIEALFAKHRPRAVVHFAAESHVDRSIHGPGEFISTNIQGTFNLLQCSLAYWNHSVGPVECLGAAALVDGCEWSRYDWSRYDWSRYDWLRLLMLSSSGMFYVDVPFSCFGRCRLWTLAAHWPVCSE